MVLSQIIDSIRYNLPESAEDIPEAFSYMIEEGIIMSFSMILNKLRTDIYHPLVVID